METYDLESWSKFKSKIEEIRQKYGAFTINGSDAAYVHKVRILFRGQSSGEWELKTTLERETEEEVDILSYWDIARRCVHEIEAYTGKKWNLGDYSKIQEEVNQNEWILFLPHYDYLVYLRHHGFPSPLLDWTESPYIAAYFAFFEKVSTERVAVYIFIETPNGGKSVEVGGPEISVLGPHTTTDTRHFRQKAWYTVATKWEKAATELENDRRVFCSHDPITGIDQDVLIKITIPSKERDAVLCELNDYNINHYTLFGSEDALVKALAMKFFYEKKESFKRVSHITVPDEGLRR